MKTLKILRNVLIVIALASFTNSCQKDAVIDQAVDQRITTDDGSSTPDYIPGKYIVELRDEAIPADRLSESMDYISRGEAVRNAARKILDENSIEAPEFDCVYGNAILGFAGSLTEADVAKLSIDPRVKHIEQDQYISLGKGGVPGPNIPPPGTTIPWGIDRVGGTATSSYTGGQKTWIIDSGIDLDHPDLNVDVASSITSPWVSTNDNPSADDLYGHGTHVAGTVAANYNSTTEIVGVAPGAWVVAVRVLNANGMGPYSDILFGINYVAANAADGDVANMSLGGPYSQTLNNAVQNASNQAGKHIYFSIAAGNNTIDASNRSPASANGPYIYTVSAMKQGDKFASFSNFGAPVDICAPGVGILSTFKDGGYAIGSGTSMSAPHVAGIILMRTSNNLSPVVDTDGRVKFDPDSPKDYIAHL